MFIKTYHPKSSMLPTKDSIAKILKVGWICQAKKNGFRVQLHILEDQVANFTRHGKRHTRGLPPELKQGLLNYCPGTALVGEWVWHEKAIYLFDCIKFENKVIDHMSYSERHALIPEERPMEGKIYKLPLITDADEAYAALMDEANEGLVFKNPKAIGFGNNSIIRCRRNGISFVPEKQKKES